MTYAITNGPCPIVVQYGPLLAQVITTAPIADEPTTDGCHSGRLKGFTKATVTFRDACLERPAQIDLPPFG